MAVADRRIIKNAPLRVQFPIRNQSTGALISAATAIDEEVSKDDGAFADLAGANTEIATTSGVYFVDMTATEMSADQIVLKVTSTSANAQTYVEVLRPEPGLDSGVAQAGAASSISLAATASATNDLYNGAVVEAVSGTGAGQIRTITDYDGASKVATVDRAWATNPDATTVYLVHPRTGASFSSTILHKVDVQELNGDAGAADSLEAAYDGAPLTLTVNDVTPLVGDFDIVGVNFTASATDSFYSAVNAVMTFRTGTLKGLSNRITGYTGATKNCAFSTAWPVAPANGDAAVIMGRIS